jgi:hypothetical protein
VPRAGECAHCGGIYLFLRNAAGTNEMSLEGAESSGTSVKTEANPAKLELALNDLATTLKTTNGKIKYYALAIIAGGLFFLFGLFAGLSGREVPFASMPQPPTMTECITSTLNTLNLKPPSLTGLSDVQGYCYSVVRSQGLLNDFTFRRLNFVQQYRANGILMWMVVVITISGVFLAAIQLFASYQLALTQRTAFTQSDEISLKRDQIVLKSSVTGLFILLLSFAFFLVFVLYVYRFQRLNDEDLQTSQQTQALPIGRLGPPPDTSTSDSKTPDSSK